MKKSVKASGQMDAWSLQQRIDKHIRVIAKLEERRKAHCCLLGVTSIELSKLGFAPEVIRDVDQCLYQKVDRLDKAIVYRRGLRDELVARRMK